LIDTPEIKYLQVYYRPNNPWPSRTFGTFGDVFERKEFLDFTTCSFMEKIIEGKFLEHAHGFTVKELGSQDSASLKEISEYLAGRIKNKLVYNASSLTENDLLLPGISRKYENAGLKRERKVFVLMKEGNVLAFSIADDTSLGVNLAGILNSFKVYDVDTVIEDYLLGKRLLVEKVLDFYKNGGNEKAIILTEDKDVSFYENLGFRKIKEYVCFTSYREAFAGFQEFLSKSYSKKQISENFRKA
jgi:hypothetical protein